MPPPREVILRHSLPLLQYQIWVCCSPFCPCILPPATAHVAESRVGSRHQYIVLTPHTGLSALEGVFLRKQCDNCEESLLISSETEKGFIPEECTSLHDCFTNTSSDSLGRGATLHTSYGCKAIETWCPKSYLNWNWHRHADTLLVVFGDKELGRACYLSPVFTCRTCLMLATSWIFLGFLFFFSFGFSSSCLRRVIYLHFFQGRGAEKFVPRWQIFRIV